MVICGGEAILPCSETVRNCSIMGEFQGLSTLRDIMLENIDLKIADIYSELGGVKNLMIIHQVLDEGAFKTPVVR